MPMISSHNSEEVSSTLANLKIPALLTKTSSLAEALNCGLHCLFPVALVNHVQSDKKAFPAGLAYLGFYSATFRTDAELRSKWVLRGGLAMVASTSPMYGEKASYYSAVCLETAEVE